MKIYYSKFVGVGYLVFAVGIFFQFFFFLAHGLIDFSQLIFSQWSQPFSFSLLSIQRLQASKDFLATDSPLNSPLKVFMSILDSSFPRKSSSQRRIVASIVC